MIEQYVLQHLQNVAISLDNIHEHLRFMAERMSETAQAPSKDQLVAQYVAGLLANPHHEMSQEEMLGYAMSMADKTIAARNTT